MLFKIKLLRGNEMLTLKKCYLENHWLAGLSANGMVYGHYRLEDGDFIQTSNIEKIYAWETHGYILETVSGSLYQVYESELSGDHIVETKKMIDEIGVIEEPSISEKLRKVNDDFLHKRQLRDAILKKSEEHVEKQLGNNELYLLMEGMNVIKALFRYEDSVYKVEPHVHVGMFQDSVLITDWEHGYVDFRYFPKAKMEPYHWSDGLEKLHICNIGTYDFYFEASRGDILCKKEEIAVISKDKYRGEGLFSPDVVNGKCYFVQNKK